MKPLMKGMPPSQSKNAETLARAKGLSLIHPLKIQEGHEDTISLEMATEIQRFGNHAGDLAMKRVEHVEYRRCR
jgi:hypothetical protein